MELMFTTIAANPLACVAGLFGMVCLAIFPLFHARTAMLSVYIGNNLAFVAHYGLLHEWTAAAMNGLMAVQTLVAIRIAEEPRYRWVYYLLMILLVFIVAVTWQGVPSVFAGMAAAFSTFGRMQSRELPLRLLLLMAMPCWLAHDIIVSSMPGFIADLLSIGVGLYMLYQRCWRVASPTALLHRRVTSA